MFRFIKTLLLRSVAGYLRDECGHLAAAISYFTLFSLFPLLIFVVAIAGLVIQDRGVQDDIVDEVLNNIPLNEGEGRDTVTEAVRGVGSAGSGALGLFALAAMAWAASSLFGALRKALNSVFDDDESKRPFVPQKTIDLALVLAVSAFFLVSIGATAFVRIVRTHSSELGSLGDAAEGAGLLWDGVSYLIPLTLSVIAFAALFCIVPSRLRSPIQVWPGVLVAALAFEATKLGFSFYLENFSNFDVVFGSLGAVAAFLFWIYVSACIMLFGAEVAAEYPRVLAEGYEQPATEGPKPPLRKRALDAFRGLFVRPRKAEAREEAGESEPGRPPDATPTRRDVPRA